MATLSAYERLQARIASHRAQGWDTTALEASLATLPKPAHVAAAERKQEAAAYTAQVRSTLARVYLKQPGAMGELLGMVDAAMDKVPGHGR